MLAASELTTGGLERYRRIRADTERLAESLSAEDCQVQSMPDASPTKWHLAHTTWFFETFVLARADTAYRPVDPSYGFLFNSYYEAVGPRHARPKRGLLSRPSLEQVLEYRRVIDERLAALTSPARRAFDALIETGLHHEQQHQELILTDIKHAFGSSPLEPAYRRAPLSSAPPAPRLGWVLHEGGLVQIGHDEGGFSYDNERPRHSVYVQPFELGSRLVTNGELIDFIEDGGYTRPELWLSDGWATVQREGWRLPLYWRHDSGSYTVLTLAGRQKVDPNEPVCHVSYYEADAFARWAGARLPTEQEWEMAAAVLPVEGNFVDRGRLHPQGAAPGPGLSQMFGDAWEWTQSPYAPYPGFRPESGALGEYNGKFMCNQMVLRGGSCATPKDHMRATYRNFFPPDARWQFSGLRLARDAR